MTRRPARETMPKLGVVGATGTVGEVLLSLLPMREDRWGEVRLIATGRSEGLVRRVNGVEVEVQPLNRETLTGLDIVVFLTPRQVVQEWATVAVELGAVVVDNSGASRNDQEVPLVAPMVNGAHAHVRPRGIVATPSATTLTMIDALGALHAGWELTDVVIASYQAASGTGRAGVERLHDEIEVVANDRHLGRQTGDVRAAVTDKLGEASPFPAPLALNVIPWSGAPDENGWTTEEVEVGYEIRRVLDVPTLPISATLVQVPVVAAHSAVVHARFARPIPVSDARQALIEAPSVVVMDDGEHLEIPTPADVVGSDPVFVGRMRQTVGNERGLEFFVTGDSLRVGSALTVIKVAELIADELDLTSSPAHASSS